RGSSPRKAITQHHPNDSVFVEPPGDPVALGANNNTSVASARADDDHRTVGGGWPVDCNDRGIIIEGPIALLRRLLWLLGTLAIAMICLTFVALGAHALFLLALGLFLASAFQYFGAFFAYLNLLSATRRSIILKQKISPQGYACQARISAFTAEFVVQRDVKTAFPGKFATVMGSPLLLRTSRKWTTSLSNMNKIAKVIVLIGAAAMVSFSFSSCATPAASCCGSDGACCATESAK
ncbi:MAG: hypothetical protein MK312_04780, partial [Roseibacillus sp.]|nr:hypothetical protein [Roseibacillus sp.]